ncbi:hypothetical protein DZB72_15070 [Bacillus sp. MT]|nr:hypothetical protein EQI87_03450 [Bacillus subtilis]RFB02718.1 hypothetical protein DZB72_15070 [Bacillus sp. MT]
MTMTSHLIEVGIPFCYKWLAEGAPNRAQLFRAYVEGYLKTNEPGLRLVRISGMTALCERK